MHSTIASTTAVSYMQDRVWLFKTLARVIIPKLKQFNNSCIRAINNSMSWESFQKIVSVIQHSHYVSETFQKQEATIIRRTMQITKSKLKRWPANFAVCASFHCRETADATHLSSSRNVRPVTAADTLKNWRWRATLVSRCIFQYLNARDTLHNLLCKLLCTAPSFPKPEQHSPRLNAPRGH